MRNKNNKKTGGYTIIETMISVSLFTIIVTIALGSLLNANLLHKKSQNMRSILDNLSFVMEDMSRNLRVGYDYHCIDDGNFVLVNPHSCVVGGGISFKSALGGQWVYYISPDEKIFKIVNGATVQLTPDEIKISPASSFTVVGAEPPEYDDDGNLTSTDDTQPFVTIKLVGKIKLQNNVETPFSLQTSVSQRKIDI
jgi:type II secretory pathway pseudopilin PulG